MKTLISLFAAAAIILPVAASAATISNPLFSNGDTTISATGGSTVSGTFALTVAPNEVCEMIGTQSDPSQARIDNSVGGQLGYQEGYYSSVPFTVKAPPNTSTVFPTVQCAGIYGGIRSVSGADNVVVGPVNLGTLRVTANSSTSSGDVGSLTGWEAAIAALTAKFNTLLDKFNAPAPVNPNCPVMVYTGFNASAVQSWLMNHGQAAAFNAAGVYAPTGHWGTISGGAYTAATTACAK